jgi:hypothetical protein
MRRVKPMESPITDIAHTIQLAVAPVFLLTALGTILGVLSTRLGRIVDRARVIAERLSHVDAHGRDQLTLELRSLARRRTLVNHAITACTSAALLVCLLIAFAFLGSILRVDFSKVLAGLFIVAIGAFTAGLVLFLREVLVAVASVRIGAEG